jgi:hypothetical protein
MLRAGGDGVYNIPALNASSQLYIRGKKFEDYITELVLEDQFEQEEITELKLLVQYLNTSGLSSEWIVDNNNKNQDLKTLITALETKLAQITTTGLTESSVLNNDNRNSVLKTRLDTTDGNVTTLTTKTRYVTVNHNSGPLENEAYMSIDAIATGNRTLELSVGGANHELIMQNYPGVTSANYIGLNVLGGKILLDSNITEIDSAVDVGKFDGSRDGREFRIGGAMGKIRIGSVNDPILGSGIGDPNTNDTTEIHIGKQTALKNTKTYLNGNIYTADARLEDLAVTDVVTWQTAASWASGFVFSGGLPYWLAWIGLSGTPNYRYADVVKMANNYLTGGLTKNHSIETSNDLAIKALSVINTDIVSLSTPLDGLLNRLVFQAFAIHGSHHLGVVKGGIKQYVGDGEIEIRNDGGIFDFVFKDAGNANQLKIKNADVELIQCNGTEGTTNKLILGACCGNIDMITAITGIRSNATKVMEVKGNKQVKIGSNSDAIVDDTYKVLIDAATHTNGIKLVKSNDALLLNPTNVSSKSITFQDGYTGATAKTLYTTESGTKLFFGDTQLVPSQGGGGGSSTAADYDEINTLITTMNTASKPTPTYYGLFSLVPNMYEARLYTDMFITPDGKYAWTVGNNLDNTLNAPMVCDNYGFNWNTTNTVDNFRTLAGTSTGLYVWAIASGVAQNNQPYNVIYRTDFTLNNPSFDWTAQPVITLDNFNTAALPQQIRVSADGTYQIITDYRANTNGKVYLSEDGGKIWTTTNLTPNHITRCVGCAVNATGEIMFVCVDGISTGQGGIYRSKDYGATWSRVLTAPASPHLRVSCDATGRYVAVARGTNAQVSRDYGASWRVVLNAGSLSVSVSPDGQYTWLGSLNGNLTYSPDFMTQFILANTPRPAGNTYVNQAHDVIISSNEGAIVIAAGIEGNMNLYRQPAQEVRSLNDSGTIRVVAAANTAGAYSLEIKNVSSGTNNVQRSVVEDQLAPVAGSGNTPPEDRLIAATTIVPRKASLYINGWQTVTTISQTGTHQDAYISDTGRYLLSAMGVPNALTQYQLNLHRGYTDESPWVLVGPVKFWKSVCGSSIGNRMYAVSAKNSLGDFNNTLYTSVDYGTNWTLLNTTPAAFNTNNTIGQIRCCGVGRNVFISSGTTGVVYRSTDFGANWVTITVGTGSGTIPSICVNSVGQYVFAAVTNIGIFRSYDFGATFQQINSSTTQWQNISCSATAQFVVATRSGQTYAFSDDYGTTWAFGASVWHDATMSHSGNLVWFCRDNQVAYSDNNGLTIKATYTSNYNHQSIVMDTNGNFVFSPLNAGTGNNPMTIEALMLREPDNNVRNIAAGTGITLDNDLRGGFTINASAPASSSAFQFAGYMSFADQSVFNTLPVMNFQDYDYEANLHILNLPGDQFVFMFFNGVNTATWEGEFIYMGNATLFNIGNDQSVPYAMNNRADAVTFLPGTNVGSNAARDMILTLRFRGISANRFSVVQTHRPQLFYTTAVAGASAPVGWGGMVRATYTVTGNNATWAPQSIRFMTNGNRPVRMTWHRINKISSA